MTPGPPGRLRVAIDVTSAVDPRPSGVARYVRGLVDGLAGRAEVDLALLCRASRFRGADPRALFPAVARWHDVARPAGFDLFHAPDLRPPRRSPENLIVTIHDLSALDREDHASARFIARKRRWLARAAASAARVITDTEAVRRQVIARLGIAPERVVAVPLWPALPAVGGIEPGARTDLLVVGGPSRRKRSGTIDTLLAALGAATGLAPAVDWCGSALPEEIAEFRASLPAATRARIRFLGHISDAELDRRLRGAAALLQLSDTEGFGLPLIEAAARGTPVIVRRSATAEEVLPAGGAFWIGGADEAEQLRAFADPAERAPRVAHAAAAAARYTREATVAATLAVYREAVSGRSATAAAG